MLPISRTFTVVTETERTSAVRRRRSMQMSPSPRRARAGAVLVPVTVNSGALITQVPNGFQLLSASLWSTTLR